jgi:hypothetical protein
MPSASDSTEHGAEVEADNDFFVTSTANRSFIWARWFDGSTATRVFFVNSLPNQSINFSSNRSPPRPDSDTDESGWKRPSRTATTVAVVEVAPTSRTTVLRSIGSASRPASSVAAYAVKAEAASGTVWTTLMPASSAAARRALA